MESMMGSVWTVSGYLGMAYIPMALAFAGFAAWAVGRIHGLRQMNQALLNEREQTCPPK